MVGFLKNLLRKFEADMEFRTKRLRIFDATPRQAAQLCASLLKEDEVAALVPWMNGKDAKEVGQEMLRIELLCGAESLNVWAIQRLEDHVLIGAVMETPSLMGSNVEAILGRQYWNLGYSDEALAPVLEWIGS
ncbi:GNAT family N-acetyltransferase [Burkholderia cepacia]|uniref:GNAT family N-acetyltransferase n=1 Tax=Burkholderia cepacia TaxID=292 RepID=UPI00157528CD|nr:GNAT family N-acetyltransferase [Burkholderia cepacia]NTX25090.1 GNAT family N-acetyltransferase [Burkholderia cepacia]